MVFSYRNIYNGLYNPQFYSQKKKTTTVLTENYLINHSQNHINQQTKIYFTSITLKFTSNWSELKLLVSYQFC